MKVTFYGVRGSTPAPGAEFVRYGGNTACVHVELSDGTDIVLDSGTGIRKLGQTLASKTTPVHVLLSHNHWDHIQGFPFFTPIYQPDREIIITAGQTYFNDHDAVIEQMRGSTFPVNPEHLPSKIQFHKLDKEQIQWDINTATIRRLKINHPGGGSAYLITEGKSTLAYITDNELYPPYKKENDFTDFVNFAQNVDLLIHDAQYLDSDMPKKSGWGHSIANEGVELAIASHAKQLALYSHDPDRTDDDIDGIVKESKAFVTSIESNLDIFAAQENLTIEL